MSETFNITTFTDHNKPIPAGEEWRGVKIDVEDKLLVISPYGLNGYKKGGEVYNYFNLHFGDEVRGVFEIPLKDIKNISTTEIQLGMRVITCLEFGGHGIAFMGLKSKTIEFTRKISNQVNKAGYHIGSSEEYMPKLEFATSASRKSLIETLGFKSWKNLGLSFGVIILGIWFLAATETGNTITNKFISYFEPTFESVMYDSCVLEGKHSANTCSCLSKEMNRILPEDGKTDLLRVYELESGKSSGFQADLKTLSSGLKYLPQMIKASESCGIKIF